MSMNYWSVDGFGVNEEDLTPTIDAQISFIKKYLPDQYEEMQENANDNCDMNNTSDYLDYCRDWIENFDDGNCDTGFGVLFTMAIRDNEEGFDPEYYYDDGCGAIIYPDRQPWDMSERVKAMSKDDMAAVFQKYLDDLGIKATIGRQTVEFFG